MTDNIENSESLLVSPPLQANSQDKKHWLAGIWLLPGVESKLLSNRYNVLHYHWDDRIKLAIDIESIKAHIRSLKEILYPTLNLIHQVNYSARYWDLLVGEWIYLYVQVIFDRWSVMETAFKTLKKPKVINNSLLESRIPFDTSSFQRLALSDHDWNGNLMTDIYKDFFGNFDREIDKSIGIDKPPRVDQKRSRNIMRLLRIVSKIYVTFIGNEKAILVQTPYLNKMDSIKLCIKIKGLIYFESTEQYVPNEEECNVEMRRKLSEFLESRFLEEPFFNFLLKNIKLYFPAIYLEEYASHKSYSERSYFNYFPRKIVTANSHYSNESWKSWAASSAEKGAQIVLMQHGGHYGHSKFSLIQDYEIELADKFLSWGWIDGNHKKVIAVPANKLISLKINRRTRETCLVVTFEASTHPTWLASFPIGPQVVRSKGMTLEFLNRIENPVRDAIRLRTYPQDFGLNQKVEFQLKFPELDFSPENREFKTDLRDARIVVFNYFSTTFIEAVKMGIPSVAFVDPNHWEVSKSFEALFSSLIRIGVLHHSSDSCAEFLMQNWDSVDSWWSNAATIKVIGEFLEVFGYTGSNPIGELSRAILEN